MTRYEPENELGSAQELDVAIFSRRNHFKLSSTKDVLNLECDANSSKCRIMVNGHEAIVYEPEAYLSLEEFCNHLDSVEINDPETNVKENGLDNDLIHNPVTALDVTGCPSSAIYSRDKDGDTLLHTAIILQEFSLIMHFISKASSGIWLSLQNCLFQTPLHLATLTNQPDVVRRLVVGGANLEARDKDGNTALHIACRDGLIQIAISLLEPVRYHETMQNAYELPYQAIPQDMIIANYEGLTCLHLAAMNGHLDIVEVLMKRDTDVNLKDGKTGRSILHYACSSGNIKLVRLLLSHTLCNINAHAFDESTPFDLARACGHEDIGMALAAAGARYGDQYSDSE